MTESIRTHPRIVLWPETVITVYLSGEPELRSRFAQLAQEMQTTLVVGSDDREEGRAYNALWFFNAAGDEATYHKEHLVPFAEYLPARQVLGALPVSGLISTFSPGTGTGVYDAGGIPAAPIICYESGFSDLVFSRVAAGAQLLLIATDDGWFGTSAGLDQHAEIASLRAVESGRWTVRAAATGISGIVAPDGRYTGRLGIDERGILTGNVGPPQPTVFSRIGPHAITSVFVVALFAIVGFGRQKLRVATIVSA